MRTCHSEAGTSSFAILSLFYPFLHFDVSFGILPLVFDFKRAENAYIIFHSLNLATLFSISRWGSADSIDVAAVLTL